MRTIVPKDYPLSHFNDIAVKVSIRGWQFQSFRSIDFDHFMSPLQDQSKYPYIKLFFETFANL